GESRAQVWPRAGDLPRQRSRTEAEVAAQNSNQVRSSASDLDLSKLTVTCASSWEIGSDVEAMSISRPRSTSLDSWSRAERSRLS
ncbi:MAG: hypothetical protein WAQ33_16960, partial [Gaiellaceae bacterium]